MRKPLSHVVRFEILKRDKFTCRYCGSKSPMVHLMVDHIIPVSRGGNNDIKNLVTSCANCNSGKSDIPLKEIRFANRSLEIIKYKIFSTRLPSKILSLLRNQSKNTGVPITKIVSKIIRQELIERKSK